MKRRIFLSRAQLCAWAQVCTDASGGNRTKVGFTPTVSQGAAAIFSSGWPELEERQSLSNLHVSEWDPSAVDAGMATGSVLAVLLSGP